MQLIELTRFGYAFTLLFLLKVKVFYSNLESFIIRNVLPVKLKHGILLDDINRRVKNLTSYDAPLKLPFENYKLPYFLNTGETSGSFNCLGKCNLQRNC